MEKLLDDKTIRENYHRITENVRNAMELSHRTDKVRLMAVTKTVPPERVNFAIDLGIDLLGENRVQEYMEKRESYSPAEVHFIGGLQTNKVKYIIDKVSMIHSVDSLHLAEEINRRAEQHGIVMDILAEINIGGEDTKGGISPDSAERFCGDLAMLKNVRLRGLMAIPPPGCPESTFAQMEELFGKLKSGSECFDTLSMGMSADYTTAIKHGATIVRIGSALFGQRTYTKQQ